MPAGTGQPISRGRRNSMMVLALHTWVWQSEPRLLWLKRNRGPSPPGSDGAGGRLAIAIYHRLLRPSQGAGVGFGAVAVGAALTLKGWCRQAGTLDWRVTRSWRGVQ